MLSSITLTETAGLATFDAGDVQWTASGGTIPASANALMAVMVTMASAAGGLLFNIDFGQEEQAGDGTDFKITWNGSGIFDVS